MYDSALLSICIPTYQRREYLLYVLKTLKPFQSSLQIIVGDNSETPSLSSKEISDFNVMYFHHKKNIGPLENFRFLVKKASCEYFIMLNDDDCLLDLNKLLYVFRNENLKNLGSIVFWKTIMFHDNDLPTSHSNENIAMNDIKELTLNDLLFGMFAARNIQLYPSAVSWRSRDFISSGNWPDYQLSFDVFKVFDYNMDVKINYIDETFTGYRIHHENISLKTKNYWRYNVIEVLQLIFRKRSLKLTKLLLKYAAKNFKIIFLGYFKKRKISFIFSWTLIKIVVTDYFFFKKLFRTERINKVFDVGANEGLKSQLFQLLSCKILLVEPDPNLYSLLQHTFKRQVVLNRAVGSENEDLILYKYKKTGYNTCNPDRHEFLLENMPEIAENYNKEIIQGTTLETLIGDYFLPDYIKLDIEGNEMNALKGLKTSPNLLSIEINKSENTDLLYLHTELLRLGFKMFLVYRNKFNFSIQWSKISIKNLNENFFLLKEEESFELFVKK